MKSANEIIRIEPAWSCSNPVCLVSSHSSGRTDLRRWSRSPNLKSEFTSLTNYTASDLRRIQWFRRRIHSVHCCPRYSENNRLPTVVHPVERRWELREWRRERLIAFWNGYRIRYKENVDTRWQWTPMFAFGTLVMTERSKGAYIEQFRCSICVFADQCSDFLFHSRISLFPDLLLLLSNPNLTHSPISSAADFRSSLYKRLWFDALSRDGNFWIWRIWGDYLLTIHLGKYSCWT